MRTHAPTVTDRRACGRLSSHQDALEAWLGDLVSAVEARGEAVALHPVIREFQRLIDSDPIIRMYMTEMIIQVPHAKPYRQRHLKSVEQMLTLINEALTQAPDLQTTELVGAPLHAIIDWTMGTPAGSAAFRDARVNAIFKKILDVGTTSSRAA